MAAYLVVRYLDPLVGSGGFDYVADFGAQLPAMVIGSMLGGGVGIADHIQIGDRAQVGARSGVMHDIPGNERWVGAPAMPAREFFRQVAALQALAKSRKGERE